MKHEAQTRLVQAHAYSSENRARRQESRWKVGRARHAADRDSIEPPPSLLRFPARERFQANDHFGLVVLPFAQCE